MLTRNEAHQEYKRLAAEALKEGGDAPKQLARALALGDLFYLLVFVFGRKDLDRDWLYMRCREVQANPDGYLDIWAREHYKALDVKTPVWTTRGWKAHGDLRFGDKVFSSDGRIVRVIANTGGMEGADCYDVGGVVAAGDHLWPVQVKHRARVVGGRDVWYETVLTSTREMGAARLPNAMPLQGSAEVTQPVPPYVLGVWLGDGHSACGRVTNEDDEIWGLLRWESKVGSVPITRNLPGLMPLLRGLSVLNNKHIPDSYLQAGPKDRLALLQGLMDTDGHVNTRGTATFCNTNEKLIDGVAFLARSLGMRARKRRYEVNGHAGYWQVSFQAYHGQYCPFRLTRKKARCKAGFANMRRVTPRPVDTRTVNCIQVEGGSYLAGESLMPTHNSTIITYALTIQDILNNPELTVGIFSHTRPIAKGFLRQIKREFESNYTLQALFPDILFQNPSKESPKWSEDDGIVVKRKSNPKEATVEAWGLVDGQPTSKHFRLRVYDDIVTKESVSNPDMILKVTQAWELSLNLGAEGGKVRGAGTFYHFNDTYRTIIERGALTPRIYPVTKEGTLEGTPVLLSRESMVKKRKDMGPYTFGTQMLLNPKGDNVQGFEENWLKFWPANHYANLNKIILVDPANEKKKGSDYTCMMVIGLGEDENFYVIDIIRDRLSLTERANQLFKLHRDFRPYFVGYEKYGKDSDIDHFKDRMNRENYRFMIRELGGNLGKNDRIRTLVPLFEAGRIFLPDFCIHQNYEGVQEDLTKVFVNEEYKAFPVSAHDDMLDCLRRITDEDVPKLWPEPEHIDLPPYMVGSVGNRGIPRQITDYDVFEGG